MTDSKDTHTQALPTPDAGPRMAHVPVTSVAASLTNPRKYFDPAKLQELADSIAASGVHQPILLRPLPAHRLEDTLQTARANKQPAPEYELVAGERRWRACQLAKVADIPAMIRPMTDAQALEAQVIENLQREDVTELEEAEGYQILMDTCSINADEVGQRIGKSRSYVYGRLKILELCEAGRQALREGKLDFSAGLYIARIPNEQLQIKALEWASQTDYIGDRMSARNVQAHVRSNFMLDLAHAKFDREDANLCPNAGTCSACPNRTGANPDLFTDVDSADVCTNPPCYHAKAEANTAQLRDRAQAAGAEIITGREAKALIPTAYSGSIDGFVRLDVAADSPIKGKPLRTVVGKALEQAGIVPTLIENPHAKTELIAVVRTEQAAELLKIAGKADAEAQLREDAKEDAEAKARQEEKEAAIQYERDWRALLAERTIKTLANFPLPEKLSLQYVEATVAKYVLHTLNKEDATRLTKILDLGKVAPNETLLGMLQDNDAPCLLAACVLVLRNSMYMPYGVMTNHAQATQDNALLLGMAKACSVDVEAIKAEVQANHRAAIDAAKAAASPDKSEAPKANTPLTPASRNNKGVGKGKAKNTNGPAALAGGSGGKLSANEASARIAAAMQALPETESGADAPSNEAVPVVADATQAQPPLVSLKKSKLATPPATTPAAVGTGESADDGQGGADVQTGAAAKQAERQPLGATVRVTKAQPGSKQERYIGKTGTVNSHAQRGRVEVTFPNPKAHVSVPVFVLFMPDELEILP